MKAFSELTEREVLAVAISGEEEDSRIYLSFAEDLAERYPDSAKVFSEMAEQEKGHRHLLLQMFEERFGPNLPPIRRGDVKGFIRRRPIWLVTSSSSSGVDRCACRGSRTESPSAGRCTMRAAQRSMAASKSSRLPRPPAQCRDGKIRRSCPGCKTQHISLQSAG